MSKCMTIDDSIDQKDTCTEIAPKEIVEHILEEVVVSALLVSDKGCSRIGDFNITEDFCQQYDRLPYLKDFEQISYTANPSDTTQESNANSGKSTERAPSLVTAKENLELIIDSFVNKDERNKAVGECTIISQEVLADNELQIQNGQSHIEKNNRGKSFPEAPARDYFHKKDVIRDEKIEIQFYNEGKLSKIYVPLVPSNRIDVGTHLGLDRKRDGNGNENEAEDRKEEETGGKQWSRTEAEDTERPFKPFTAEEFQQVFSDDSVDPNRPRACAFGEEDVKKIIKEIEEISFTQSHLNPEDLDLSFHPDGQGDADLESRSFTRSKDSLEKILNDERPKELLFNSSSDLKLDKTKFSEEFPAEEEREVFSSEQLLLDQKRQNPSETSVSEQSLQYLSDKIAPEVQRLTNSVGDSSCVSKMSGTNSSNACDDFKAFRENVKGEQHLQYKVLEEESLLKSSIYGDRLGSGGNSDQALEPAFLVDPPPGRQPSESVERLEDKSKSYIVLTDKKEEQNESNTNDSPSWETAEILFGSKQDQLPERNFQLSSERDVRNLQENPSDTSKSSCSVNASHDEDVGLKISSVFESSDCRGRDAKGHSQEPDAPLDCDENNFRLPPTSNDSFVIARDVSDEVRDSGVRSASHAKDFSDSDSHEEVSSKDSEELREGSSMASKKTSKEHEREKSLGNANDLEDKVTSIEYSPSSSTSFQQQNSSQSLTGSGADEDRDDSVTRSQNFKLHSQKMYSGVNQEPDGQAQKECILTESEEALIDETESVLQIIEPQEHSEDEDSSQVSFSLLCKPSREFSAPTNDLLEKIQSSEEETPAKKVYSGMTTIGPLKNTDYDPKDLAVPNIDYGKMTRITSSRQLAKEIDMFGTDLSAAASVKILEDDSDNDISGNLDDGDQMDFTSLVNRDIASLTKVQKVREVMSHQPKPEDDFEDDDALPRPRLDLKDVESMTDERYKVPEVSIPLLSLEIGDSNGAEKELIENMGLVLSSLTNPVYFEEDFDENNSESQKENLEGEYVETSKPSEERPVEKTDSPIAAEETNEENLVSYLEKESSEEKNLQQAASAHSQQDHGSSSLKYCTLGSVFRKASNKFIRRDGDLFLRNSKSLPRDTSKITATESIRSILDDCQSSASSMLKKSKSLLKNTQSIFKSMSSGRVTTDPDSGHGVEKKKVSPSESDVSTLERKFSTFLKKEDFTKAKNLIKSTVEKTLKNFDSGTSTTHEKVSSEKKDLRVAVIDEDKLRVDRIENFRKLLPKSPLVYKSQFVKSQISMQNNSTEAMEVGSNCAMKTADDGHSGTDNFTVALVENRSDSGAVEEPEMPKPAGSEVKIPLQEKAQWLTDRDELRLKEEEESEPQQPEFIVMETIQGLPTTDLDSPSSDKENIGMKSREQVEREAGNEMKKTEASNSVQSCADGVNDIAPCFPDSEEEKTAAKTPSDRKIKTKKKKLTARFRSFWCSAFGKVKASPKKGDHS